MCYIFAGCASTITSLCLIELLPFSLYLNTSAAYFAGLVVGFFINSSLTFSVPPSSRNFRRYCLLHTLLSDFVSTSTVLIEDKIGLLASIAYLCSLPPAIIIGFVFQKYFVFVNAK